MIFRQGNVTPNAQELVHDVRLVMSPYTAVKLSENSKNKMKDFESIAGPLGVSHFMTFSETDLSTNCRIMRFPRGPTLSFQVEKYSLMQDIAALQKRPHSKVGVEYQHSPLVVLNGFSKAEKHDEIVGAMLQNMFPPINVDKIKLPNCRRVVMFNLEEDSTLEMRHYYINAAPTGVKKSVRKVVKGGIPKRLKKLEDISQLLLDEDMGGVSSDSEADDLPESRVELPQDYIGRGNLRSHKSAVRLQELGPRIRLKLVKIEDGFHDGEILYHRYVQKTEAEKLAIIEGRKRKLEAKEERKRVQEEHVQKKKRKNPKNISVDEEGASGGELSGEASKDGEQLSDEE